MDQRKKETSTGSGIFSDDLDISVSLRLSSGSKGNQPVFRNRDIVVFRDGSKTKTGTGFCHGQIDFDSEDQRSHQENRLIPFLGIETGYVSGIFSDDLDIIVSLNLPIHAQFLGGNLCNQCSSNIISIKTQNFECIEIKIFIIINHHQIVFCSLKIRAQRITKRLMNTQ